MAGALKVRLVRRCCGGGGGEFDIYIYCCLLMNLMRRKTTIIYERLRHLVRCWKSEESSETPLQTNQPGKMHAPDTLSNVQTVNAWLNAMQNAG